MKIFILHFIILVNIFNSPLLFAKTLDVGNGKTYSNPTQAAAIAQPGDTILLHGGNYLSAYFISNLSGKSNAWIVIRGVKKNSVILKASSEGFHLSDISYIKIQDLTFTGQTANGMNIDDNGSFETPAKNVMITNCDFINMGAQGNNDFLKLSGLDSFEISYCKFSKGATGGSAIDMVGCHYGRVLNCNFDTMGSNCIQMKGGTQFIRIENNTFRNGGQRTLNLGGSTGLAFFRPIDAKFEAADIQVYANIFIGSQAPFAYVGSERVDVANNTIYLPEKWVIRILQETVDTSRFIPCGNNMFRNNIIYYNNAVTTHVNIGSNTAAHTFLFSHNLWFNSSNSANSKPTLPNTEISPIHGKDPLFTATYNFTLQKGSPAIGSGSIISTLKTDIIGISFKNPPSMGAYEYNNTSMLLPLLSNIDINIYPNPSQGELTVESKHLIPLKITNILGQLVWEKEAIGTLQITIPHKGIYFLNYRLNDKSIIRKIVVN